VIVKDILTMKSHRRCLAQFDNCISTSQNWYLDNGASHHVTGFAQNLTSIKSKVSYAREEPHNVILRREVPITME
jgi:hypothetical protein